MTIPRLTPPDAILAAPRSLSPGDSVPVTMGTSGAMRLFCRKFEVPEDLQHYLNVPVCIERLIEDGDIFHTDQFGVYRAKD